MIEAKEIDWPLVPDWAEYVAMDALTRRTAMKAVTALVLLAVAASAQADLKALTDTHCQRINHQGLFYSQYYPVPQGYASGIERSSVGNDKPYVDIRYSRPITNKTLVPNNQPWTGNNTTTSIPFNTDFKLENGEQFSWGTKASEWNPSATRVDAQCLNNHLTYFVQLNGWDTDPGTFDSVVFGGPHVTVGTKFEIYDDRKAIKPFADDTLNNLMLQGKFTPVWNSREKSIGQVNFNVFLVNRNVRPVEIINYVIIVADSRTRNITERPTIGTDPNTNAYWVSTYVGKGTEYVTKSKYSHTAMEMERKYKDGTEDWKFYRVTIPKEKFQSVLDKIGTDSKPEDFILDLVAVQTEIALTREQSIGFGVRGFRTYLTREVM